MSLRPLRGRIDRRKTAEATADPTTAGVFDSARKSLLDSAGGGNLRAIELLARGALDALSSTPDGPAEPIAPHVAEAAVAAACVASELGPEGTAAWLAGFPTVPPVPGETV
jgi:hypothetical protein